MIEKSDIRDRMGKSVDHFVDLIASVQLDREVTPKMLENIRVAAYGSKFSLSHLAVVACQDSRTLLVRPFDKDQMKLIGHALVNCNLDLDPWKDKDQWIVRVQRPSGEDREKRISYIKKMAEEQKVSIRQIRREFRKKLEGFDKEIDALTKEHIDEIDRLTKNATDTKRFSHWWFRSRGIRGWK